MLIRVLDRVRENLKMHPDHFFKDKNFSRLVDAVERVLVYIAEKDGHYRFELAYLFMRISGEVEFQFKLKRARDPTYTVQEFFEWLSEHPAKVIV